MVEIKEYIKNNSEQIYSMEEDLDKDMISSENVLDLLDKYNNQETKPTIFIDCEDMEERYGTQLYIEYLERYKKCWEELKEDCRKRNCVVALCDFKEMEKKHNIGDKQ